ncbi:hypothetical protein GCK32_016974 [Trichostrongylus colubriformis]|uniref:Uncharacterized protein n=1 Tax=Trichostrongylus colubriformis TaxID=6319 RepID=A0AAN8G7Q8_TRICO
MFNSNNTRRKIGIVKKRLIQQRNLTEAHLQLHHSYSRIQQLHDSWSAARNADPKEEEVYDNYIKKYGDYTNIVQEAVITLESVDGILNAVDMEFIERHIQIPADTNGNTSSVRNDSSELLNNTHLNSEKIHSSPNTRQHDQSSGQAAATMNFVDASILSRLDLSTFDGNPLEYAEYFARFSALIGDKKQLDDATKFSLLKSCLKGRALQSIQGLALIGPNYHIALDILKSRYDDKVTTRHILFSQLANLPPYDSKEITLGAILLNKLPRYVRSRIYDRTGNTHNLTPSELLDVLTDIVHKESTLQEIEYHCKRIHQQHEDG